MSLRPCLSPPRTKTLRSDRGRPVRAALRTATQAEHQRVHGLEPFRAIAQTTLSREGYVQLLQSLHQFHSIIRTAAGWCSWSGLSSASGRIDLIRKDLCFLGGGTHPPSFDWKPTSQWAALGAMYAAQGSMLGGRVIASQLDYLFGDAPDGRRFFIGTASDAGTWRTLLSTLEECCLAAGPRSEAIGGARIAFDLFEKCIMAGSRETG